MNIAEFFVKLGVKGDQKTVDSLDTVGNKLKGLGSTSLEVKAGILAALYGLEKMTSSATNAGAGLMNFAATTGMSMQKLQEWKYAAQQASISGEEVEGSVKGIQSTMANMLMGGGAPKGVTMLADMMHKMGEDFDPAKSRGPGGMEYMIQNLQKLSQSGPIDIVKPMVESFGVSEGMFAAMSRGEFNQKNYDRAPKYSDKQAKGLDQMNAGFKNIWSELEVGLGKTFAKNGPKLIGEIEHIIPPLMKLVGALMELAEKTKIFEWIGKSFEGWSTLINGTADTIGDIAKDKEGILHGMKTAIGNGMEHTKDIAKGAYLSYQDSRGITGAEGVAHLRPIQHNPAKDIGNNINNTINQTFHGQAEPDKVRRAALSGTEQGLKSVVRNSHATKQKN